MVHNVWKLLKLLADKAVMVQACVLFLLKLSVEEGFNM